MIGVLPPLLKPCENVKTCGLLSSRQIHHADFFYNDTDDVTLAFTINKRDVW